MNNITDAGYISDYLVHWTGKDGDDIGAITLSSIVSDCELLLSYNPIHKYSKYHQIHEKMVCFTDVPLDLSKRHCSKYGKFGVAFKKLNLMNVGAQPVFYVSHVAKRDMHEIFKFIQDQLKGTTIPPEVFRSLHRHFYFMQNLSDNRADAHEAYYYEREWRLGTQSLPTLWEKSQPNPIHYCHQKGYGTYTGKRIRRCDRDYFLFGREDVAFLIAPKSHTTAINNPHSFPVCSF